MQYDAVVKDVQVTFENTDESRSNTPMDRLDELPGFLRPKFEDE